MAVKKHFFNTLGITFWLLTAIFAILPSWPHIYYRLYPQASGALASNIASTAVMAQSTIIEPSITPKPTSNPSPTPTPTLPDVDPSLPAENGLIIDKIGIRGEIHEGTDWKELLRLGVWRVPDFGTPIDTSPLSKGDLGGLRPIILAAHRWGYLDWSAAFRKLNSFYNLPKLKVGDKVKIVWEQRSYEYTIYSTETGTEITDYKASLILYTCQLWNSPVRYFIYANRSN